MKKLLVLAVFFINLIGLGAANSEIISQIRRDYAKANAEKNYKIEKQSLEVQTTGGGERVIYSKNGEIRKIIVVYYGEIGKTIEEFYIKNNRPYFLLATTFYYNMEEYALGNCTEMKISKKEYERYYFDPQGNLIRYVDTENKIIEDREMLKKLEEEIKNPMSHEVRKDTDF